MKKLSPLVTAHHSDWTEGSPIRMSRSRITWLYLKHFIYTTTCGEWSEVVLCYQAIAASPSRIQ